MLLIAQENLGVDDTPIGFGFRLTHFQNCGFEVNLIARAYRVRQPQPIPTQSRKNSESWLKPGRQQNENGEGMGAACSEPPKN
jgi:hypothetical protein